MRGSSPTTWEKTTSSAIVLPNKTIHHRQGHLINFTQRSNSNWVSEHLQFGKTLVFLNTQFWTQMSWKITDSMWLCLAKGTTAFQTFLRPVSRDRNMAHEDAKWITAYGVVSSIPHNASTGAHNRKRNQQKKVKTNEGRWRLDSSKPSWMTHVWATHFQISHGTTKQRPWWLIPRQSRLWDDHINGNNNLIIACGLICLLHSRLQVTSIFFPLQGQDDSIQGRSRWKDWPGQRWMYDPLYTRRS